jgi:uroporphyrinogen-III decarboxylase
MPSEKQWADLTPLERRQKRFDMWKSPAGIEFVSREAENNYKARVQRYIDAYNVQEPDRVPVSLPVGAMPAYRAGLDTYTVMYDYEKLEAAWKAFNLEFQPDTAISPAMVLPGRAYDRLDYKLYSWPGHGLPNTARGVQYVEGEYMKADEYDALINNPSDFWMRKYMPRIFGAFEPWTMLQPFTTIIELPAAHFIPYAKPELQASLQAIIDVGKELAEWTKVIARFSKWAAENGFPAARMGGLAKAPFDTLGDTLRGTKGIIRDLFRQPDKILEAIDVVTTITIEQTIAQANAVGALTVMFPLHKGADGFMSQQQFDKFYWPSLKKFCDALIEQGIIPILFAEGSYETRLDSVNEFPKGAVSWLFDRTDMGKAKKALGDKCCISGNVPVSLLTKATPAEVKGYCRKLIETCGGGGGYVLAGGASVDDGSPENMRAMMEAAQEYGVYRK